MAVFLILTCTLYSEKYVLVSLYIPPGANLAFLDKILNILDNNQTGIIIIGGDFNHSFDKLHRHSLKRKV